MTESDAICHVERSETSLAVFEMAVDSN